MAAAEDYPEGLKYHAEHDWARIEGDEAMLGVTWFAQDALGELVHFEAPADGGSTTKDASYGEVESVKAVSDVIAPLSGEILEVNQKVVDAPETVNDDPYGEGWLVRIRLSDPAEVDGLLDVDAYKQHLASSELGTATSRSPTPIARRCWRRSASRRSRSSSATSRPGVRFEGELDLEPALSEPELVRHLEELAAKNVDTTQGALVPRRRASTTTTCPAIVDAVLQRGEFLTAYTPYQPEMSQGVLQAIFEYQTAICELTGMDVSNASGYDGTTVAADACLVAKHATGRAEGRARRDAEPAGAAGREDLRARVRPRGGRGPARRRRRPTRRRCARRPRMPRP